MSTLRALIRDHRTLAILLLAAALCMKILVPQGYMIGGTSTKLTIQLCSGVAGHDSIEIAVPGQSDQHKGGKASADSPCTFAALSMASLGGADVLLLAIALAFILALGFTLACPILPYRASYLRPPLRGPPLPA